jgi:hypothetical protein
MSRKTVYTAVFAAAASGSIGAVITLAGTTAASTQANYPAVCLGVSTTGTLVGDRHVGPTCAGSVPANRCVSPTVFAPGAAVNVYACVPD